MKVYKKEVVSGVDGVIELEAQNYTASILNLGNGTLWASFNKPIDADAVEIPANVAYEHKPLETFNSIYLRTDSSTRVQVVITR